MFKWKYENLTRMRYGLSDRAPGRSNLGKGTYGVHTTGQVEELYLHFKGSKPRSPTKKKFGLNKSGNAQRGKLQSPKYYRILQRQGL
jgi:hypothetical protein